MIDYNNILLITNSDDVSKLVLSKLVLLRFNDKISVCDTQNYKSIITNSMYNVVIIHECETVSETLKLISNIKNIRDDVSIMLLLNDINPELIVKSYDVGIFDYFTLDSEDYEILIKTVNCLKLQISKNIQKRNEKFLHQLGVIDSKTNLYKQKYLKEMFIDISDDMRIQNGIFAILTLDEGIKTKVSTNRLAGILKCGLRGDDIVATARGGIFYVILPSMNLEGAKSLISKLQTKIGETYPIHCGLSKIRSNSFDSIEKNAKDSLIAAIQKNELVVCLADIRSEWLEDDIPNIESKKNFKLFQTAFTNKLTSVISPLFFRYQKSFETKLSDTLVSQYVNNIESVFCLKNNDLMSELVIRYNGFAKFHIEINHSGLDSAENSAVEIPLSQMNDKFLQSILKKLKDEYQSSTKIINKLKNEETHA